MGSTRSSWPATSFDAQTVADKTIRRLFNAMQAYAGPWVLLPGNHDAALAESVWTRAYRLGAIPPNVIACVEPGPRVVAGKCAVLAAPLVQRHTYGDLTEAFVTAETSAGLPRIGLAHGSVLGILADDIDSANPIAADRAVTARLDYLALGDWHGSKRIDDRTWYAGTPETDRFKANDSGQVLLVSIDGPGAIPTVTPVRTGRYRWQQIDCALAVPTDVDAALAQLAELDGDDVIQLRVSGVCDLAGQKRLRLGIESAAARVRALVDDTRSLRLEPTDEDIAALHADGYVGDVLRQLRDEQSGVDAERARDALVILAHLLDERAVRHGAKA